MTLTIDQRRRLHKALMQAYPATGELGLLLALLNGTPYGDLTAPGVRPVEYMNVIMQVDARGWIRDFVAAAAEDRPGLEALAALATELAAHAPLRRFTDEADAEKQSALQRIVRDGQPDEDAAVLLDAITRTSAAVCVIEWDEQPQGTGFLFGPDLVLTNWHVAHPLKGRDAARLSVRFGFQRGTDGMVAEGRRVALAADWLVVSRAYDSTDETIDPDDVPDRQALDYAVIRLAEAVEGIAPLGLDAAAPLPGVGTDLVMVQHPSGAPQKISFGRMTAVAGGGLRLRYDVNTKPGSSGSPILNHRGVLVGLHHAGDPNFAQLAQYNQGIPIGLIAADIAGGG